MRIVLCFCLLFVVLVQPAFAADKKDAKDDAGGQYVDISPVAAPIVLNGQLINYIFVTVRLNVRPGVDALRLRAREPYFRDALVRAAHRHPFVKPGDYTHVDERALKAAMMSESARIAGSGVVTGVEVKSAQAQKLSGLPKAESLSAPRAPIP